MDERAGEHRGNIGTRHVYNTARRLHADLTPEKLSDELYTNMNKPRRGSSEKSLGSAVTPRDQRGGGDKRGRRDGFQLL